MTTPNNQEDRASDLNALQILSAIQPPAGMQERIAQNLAGRVRHQQLHPVAREFAWNLWAGASIALVAAAIILCVFAVRSHSVVDQPQVANVETHKIEPAPAPAHLTQTNNAPHKIIRAHHAEKTDPDAAIPHTPPPQPLTAQERLLLKLANTPSAAGLAHSQTISQHGLGANALLELDHEQLQPLHESKLLQPLPPLPQNLP